MALEGPVYGCEKLVVARLRHLLQHVLIEVGAVASEDGFDAVGPVRLVLAAFCRPWIIASIYTLCHGLPSYRSLRCR